MKRVRKPRLPFKLHVCGRPYTPDLKSAQDAHWAMARIVSDWLCGNGGDLPSLSIHAELLRDDMRTLDRRYTHEQVVGDQDRDAVWAHHLQGGTMALSSLSSHLKEALDVARAASADVAHIFAGELKAKTDERIARYIRSAESLAKGLKEANDVRHAAWRTYELRQLCLRALFKECNLLVEKLVELKRCYKGGGLSPELRSSFNAQVDLLLAARAKLAKVRDNPRQKMVPPLTDFIVTVQAVETELRRIGKLAGRRAEDLADEAA